MGWVNILRLYVSLISLDYLITSTLEFEWKFCKFECVIYLVVLKSFNLVILMSVDNSSQATFDCAKKWINLFLSLSLSLLVQINGWTCFYHYHCDCWPLFSFTSNANRFPCYKTSKSQNSHQTNKKISDYNFIPFITVARSTI
jgi:hypothetical protein